MIQSLTAILFCQLLGEIGVNALGIPIPGPVLGMVIMFAYLMMRGGVSKPLGEVSDTLLRHLSLLFVPAGVGIVLHFDLLREDWLPIGLGLVISTLLTIVVSAAIMRRLTRKGDTT